jgi:hypothetical protein
MPENKRDFTPEEAALLLGLAALSERHEPWVIGLVNDEPDQDQNQE